MSRIQLAFLVILVCTTITAVIHTTDNHNNQYQNEKTSVNRSSTMCQTFEFAGYSTCHDANQNTKSSEHLSKSIWHLSQVKPNLDLRVREAWKMGFTGRGVVVAIVDDGLHWTHPDIRPNYDTRASYDYFDNDEDPTPQHAHNSHGTGCAGIVAASYITSKCTVGHSMQGSEVCSKVIYPGIRVLSEYKTDADNARSLNHNMDYIDIYSSSWGPTDSGKVVQGPQQLTSQALERGALKGRNGKGSIFVFAAGNGETFAESCSCNGYVSSIYTIGITAATENGDSPYYGMRCTSILATAFSNGNWDVRGITTTSSHNSCRNDFGGTSSSAAIASGIIALTLQANPNLGWRDVQHIIVRTAKSNGLKDPDWKKNGIGRRVSNTFGYGLLDAAAMVKLAKVWKPVPRQQKCQISFFKKSRTISGGGTFKLGKNSTGWSSTGSDLCRITYLEHVQLSITLKASNRGEIQVHLKSPMGTKSTLLPKRRNDVSSSGFNDWHFMTTHLWGEAAKGIWYLEVSNGNWNSAELVRFSLLMYGTSENPQL